MVISTTSAVAIALSLGEGWEGAADARPRTCRFVGLLRREGLLRGVCLPVRERQSWVSVS